MGELPECRSTGSPPVTRVGAMVPVVPVAPVVPVVAAGALAHAALVRSAGRTSAVPGFEGTGFRLAAGELIWVGDAAPLHPRVVLLEPGAAHDRLDVTPAYIHAARTLARLAVHPADAANCLSTAVARLIHECEPAGFATLFAGGRPAFPLSRRVDAALALAAACTRDDARALVAAATLLLGVGGGLTPSGDDLVGGALFARRLAGMDARWRDAVNAIRELAPARTHAISSALLLDLAAGSSYFALHDLADVIAANAADERIDLPLRSLVCIGHSSGWDMLAGFVAGLGGKMDSRVI